MTANRENSNSSHNWFVVMDWFLSRSSIFRLEPSLKAAQTAASIGSLTLSFAWADIICDLIVTCFNTLVKLERKTRPIVCNLMTKRDGTRNVLAGMILILGCVSGAPAKAELRFHWEDRFSPSEQQKLTHWLVETQGALEQLVGKFPFDVHLYLHRARSREPVPWANTERSYRQGVHFHVDPSFTLEEFKKDWTAPHELSHLVIPYLGRSNSWFAEGFASYMQYQVMHAMGMLSEGHMAQRYSRNLDRAQRNYKHRSRPFTQAASRLRAEGKYPTLYWGGAAYFMYTDQQLVKTGEPGLIEILKTYLDCCRRNRSSLDDLVADFDRLSKTTLFSTRLQRFRRIPGFPVAD